MDHKTLVRASHLTSNLDLTSLNLLTSNPMSLKVSNSRARLWVHQVTRVFLRADLKTSGPTNQKKNHSLVLEIRAFEQKIEVMM